MITAVNMGDRPSGTIATVALRKTAKMGEKEYPKEAKIVTESTHVDDIVDSVGSKNEARDVTNNISVLLHPGNFYIKGWSISDESDGEPKKILGLAWQPLNYTIQFDIRLNFSKKCRNQKTGPDLCAEDIPEKIPDQLTKRIVMAQLNGIYDPIGFLVPLTIKGKTCMRDLWAQRLDWDI